MNMKVSNGP